jgi:hypothetical protein
MIGVRALVLVSLTGLLGVAHASERNYSLKGAEREHRRALKRGQKSEIVRTIPARDSSSGKDVYAQITRHERGVTIRTTTTSGFDRHVELRTKNMDRKFHAIRGRKLEPKKAWGKNPGDQPVLAGLERTVEQLHADPLRKTPQQFAYEEAELNRMVAENNKRAEALHRQSAAYWKRYPPK